MSLQVGDIKDEATAMGPLISADQRQTVASYLEDGLPIAVQGDTPDGPGFWFPPTVLAPVSNDDRAARDGETLALLNGETVELGARFLVIADAGRQQGSPRARSRTAANDELVRTP